jgi:hypothetical protein
MIKTRHSTLYALSGIVWLAVGVMLLNLGLGFLMHGFQGNSFVQDGYSGLFSFMSFYTGTADYAAIALIIFGLVVGIAKGRFVMQKAAQKSAIRIAKLENPTSITNLYSRSNIILLGIMMCLGLGMKLFALPYDIRGTIDVAVGCALIQGSLAYFRLVTSSPTPA